MVEALLMLCVLLAAGWSARTHLENETLRDENNALRAEIKALQMIYGRR